MTIGSRAEASTKPEVEFKPPSFAATLQRRNKQKLQMVMKINESKYFAALKYSADKTLFF